jgi:hypothetical protein
MDHTNCLQVAIKTVHFITYQALVEFIKSFVERKDGQWKDTIDMSDWWKTNCAKLPAFSYALRIAACSAHQLLPT